ncbi:tripartite tricarboxylate transporter substrate binding protein [Pigmentiphaga soli]|uniref:Tripartite tricarboxylate transporter substrate binding protein n=1 Tax=Pigmentiphaga soli TaxID=1007095 RepID=A0ABP8HHJ5_9BURK
MHIARSFIRIAFVFAALFLGAAAARAEYPDKPVRIIISFPPGGASDSLARAIGKELSDAWHQTVIPENRGGANGVIAAQMLAKAPADGYTLGLVAIGHAINPLLYKNLPYDTDADFQPISLIATYPMAVLVPPGSPAKDLKSLIALAKSSPAPMTYASGGNGSSQHLAGALFAKMAGLNLTHVPYKGGAPALKDVAAGNVDMIVTLPSLPMLQSGMVRALAMTSPKRALALPDVPTLSELALPGYQSVAWYGLVAPKGLPPDVLRKLSEATIRAVHSKTVRDVSATQGGEPAGSTPEEFAAFIKAERARYEPIIREANITAE